MNPTNVAYLREIQINGISPSVVDEVNENLTYIGYCLPTCKSYNDKKWLIRRVKTTDTLQTIFFANGSSKFNQSWSERTTLTYKATEVWE